MEDYFLIHKNRLLKLVEYAKKNIPYYRESLPDDLKSALTDSNSWTSSIPLLDKKVVQAQWEKFLQSPGREMDYDVVVRRTSGSSGIPLKIVRDRGEMINIAVNIWSTRSKRINDIINKKVLTLDPFMFGEQKNIMHFTENGYVDFSTERFKRNIIDIQNFRPEWIYGFSSGVYRFAQFVLREGVKLSSVKLVEVTGEMLHENQRKVIEKAFGCKVVNMYAAQEFDILSYECEYGILHAWTKNLFFEVLRDGVPVSEGDIGELVVTSLTNYTMPLIRYKIGDLVKMESVNCPCGNQQPQLVPIGGRIGSLIKTRTKIVSSNVIKRIFDNFLGEHDQAITEYQVNNLLKLTTFIVP